jgi:hypothetical protein
MSDTPDRKQPTIIVKKKATRPVLGLNKSKPAKAVVKVKTDNPDRDVKAEQAEQKKIAAAKRKEAIKAIRKHLCETHPDVFSTESPQPLVIGIHKQIFTAYPNLSGRMVRMMLSRWVNHKSYKSALVAGASRFNLDGSVAGVVSEQEVAHLHKRHSKGQDNNG